MTDSSQNVQKGSGSQPQTGQTGQNPGSSHQGSFDKQHEQGQKQNQQNQNQSSQTPKKDVQGNESNQEHRQTGTR